MIERAPSANPAAEVTVIVVNYNTRDLTVQALETLFANAGQVSLHVVVWDNASHDGSADVIAERFPQVELIRSAENIGFGRANNAVAETAMTEWLLLLNSDTETLPGAVQNLLTFARAHSTAGIVGGRTYFRDGSLNPTSCWNRMSPWSIFCSATGLSRIFTSSTFFNSEGIGTWQRDSIRHVDIVTGCLFMLRTELWKELGGFSPRYFMYGEEHDMCLRAAKLGYRPMITPDARIMHFGGGSAVKKESRLLQLLNSKAAIIRDHWPRPKAQLGIAMLWLWIAVRHFVSLFRNFIRPGSDPNFDTWKNIWDRRHKWLSGY